MIYTKLIASLLIASLAIMETEAAYSKLNDYLVEKVVDDDAVGPNMEAAVNWLRELDGAKQSFFSISPKSEVERFTSLRQVIDDTKCDRAAYELISANAKAVDLLRLIEEKKVLRRIDKVLLKIFKNHAMNCHDVYPVNYRAKKEIFEREESGQFERVKILAENLIDSERLKLDISMRRYSVIYVARYLFDRYITGTFTGFTRKYILHLTLLYLSRNDPNLPENTKVSFVKADERTGKRVILKDKIKEAVNEYLIKPCKAYEAKFGPDLFIPAGGDDQYYHKINEDDVEYYSGWAYYEICRLVTRNEAATFDSVLKSAKDSAL